MEINTAITYPLHNYPNGQNQNTETPNADGDMKKQELSVIAVGSENDTATLEDKLSVSYKTKHTLMSSLGYILYNSNCTILEKAKR